jgi:hypothetical protein
MIDERNLVDWLTSQIRSARTPGERIMARRLLSKIKSGEFAPDPDPTSYDVRFPGAREKYLQPSYDYSKVKLNTWVDDDDQW